MAHVSRPAARSESPDSGSPIHSGWITDEVREEFPGLGLRYAIIAGGARRSPPIIKRRLEDISDEIDARRAIALRGRASAAAYRVFQRQIGLDPDLDRTPFEIAIVERMIRGAFLTRGLPLDACTIAAIETGVPVWAIDAGPLWGALGIRTADAGERLGRDGSAPQAEAGCLVIADESGPLAPLLGEPGPILSPGPLARAIVLVAVSVPGAPEPVTDEALWLASALASERP
jgi:hypothetical protein